MDLNTSHVKVKPDAVITAIVVTSFKYISC